MQKELIISTTPQETKLAILEDDELVEFYIERHRSQSIVGNIYKGKVTKVLPGMQSAFVDIGLERDAFLYVSDFFEDTEEYDKIVSTVEDELVQLQEGGSRTPPPAPIPVRAEPSVEVTPAEIPPLPKEVIEAARPAAALTGPPEDAYDQRGPRRRDRDRRGKKPKIPSFESKSYEPRPDERAFGAIEVLPGESLAKYSRRPEAERQRPPAETESGLRETIEKEDRATETTVEAARTPDATKRDLHSGAYEAGPVPPSTAPIPRELSEGSIGNEASAPIAESETEPENDEKTGSKENPTSTARITDRSDNYRFAHRSSTRRPRRGRGGPPPGKSDEHRPNGQPPRSSPMISELLREGQEILVQVSKEPLGKKGARITSHIALPGRYLVYMPTVDHVGVSRKIASDAERSRLKDVVLKNRDRFGGGIIVRTAAEEHSEEDLTNDLNYLVKLWEDVRGRAEKASGPALIHSELNLVQRLLRDQFSFEFAAVRVDEETEYQRVVEFVDKIYPNLVHRVKLFTKDTHIFDEYGITAETEKLLQPKIWLKSGGYIVINQTEALVSIDINTGKFVGRGNSLEETITRTNLEAVREIVKQIRLRDLGGIIVIDFIDMDERKNRKRVMEALSQEIAKDKAPNKILEFNEFGLVAITRKRVKQSLERTLCQPCTYCNGSGMVKSVSTTCYSIYHEIEKMANEIDGR